MIPNSVSALKARRRAKTPALPPEIWLVIFDHATYVPGILIPEIYEYSDTLGYGFNRYHHPLIRRALVTKRHLVRVCKQWWHLATPFLYRSIFIGKYRSLSSLASTLASSATGKGIFEGERPLGSYTERLDIAMRGYWNGDLGLLAEAIRHLQNLTVVSINVTSSRCFNSDMYDGDAVVDALAGVAHDLKIIDWAVPRILLRSQTLAKLVTATQLHIIHYPFILFGLADAMDSCTLSSCTTLAVSLGPIFLKLSSTQLPAIRELRYPTSSLWPLSRFLERHGENLTSIHLRWSRSTTFRDQTNLLATHCPNLQRLTIMLEVWESLDAEILELVPIERLGLDCCQNQSSTKFYKIVFASLARLKDINLTLRIVRFINHLHVNELLKNHRKALLPALELLTSGRNFRLEDHEGRLLSDRVVSSNTGCHV